MVGVIFKSTGAIINLLEKLVDARFNVSGLDNVPSGPCLFVANHFTRAETFILPYILYKYKARKVRSLADDQVFIGALGKYLKSVGTISTEDPLRNEKILSDLIIGKSDWLIYPEGVMVKNKDIRIDNNIFLNLVSEEKTIHTGAAVLALKAELLKQHYLRLDHQENLTEMENFKRDYLLEDCDILDPKPLHIVPVTINYFPLRPGDNPILQMAKRFASKLPARILEELEIEGNLILNSEVSMDIQPAINVRDFIKMQSDILHKIPKVTAEFQRSLIIKLNRFRLIKKAMLRVYQGVVINFDHIFAAIIAHYPYEEIEISLFKNLFYQIAKEIKDQTEVKLHSSIDSHLIRIFKEVENENFISILNLATKQGVVTQKEGVLLLNKEVLFAKEDFHSVRLTNNVQILLNEVSMFEEVIKIVKRNVNRSNSIIKKRLFKQIAADDLAQYYADYQQYYTKEESKDRKQGEPFYLAGKEGFPGVILSHGYKASPFEVKDLALFLQKLGYHIYVLRLKGHGTSPINIKYTSWEDWYDSYLTAYAILQQRCSKIIAAGFSTGGLLALLFASQQHKEVKAVISLNSALKIKDIKVNFVPGVHFWNDLVDLFAAEKGKKEFIIDKPENPHINYAKNYLRGVSELMKLMKKCEDNLVRVNVPALIIQGSNDPVVSPKSGDIIYKKISSLQKKLAKPRRDNHVIILGENKAEIFNEIANFIKSL